METEVTGRIVGVPIVSLKVACSPGESLGESQRAGPNMLSDYYTQIRLAQSHSRVLDKLEFLQYSANK